MAVHAHTHGRSSSRVRCAFQFTWARRLMTCLLGVDSSILVLATLARLDLLADALDVLGDGGHGDRGRGGEEDRDRGARDHGTALLVLLLGLLGSERLRALGVKRSLSVPLGNVLRKERESTPKRSERSAIRARGRCSALCAPRSNLRERQTAERREQGRPIAGRGRRTRA